LPFKKIQEDKQHRNKMDSWILKMIGTAQLKSIETKFLGTCVRLTGWNEKFAETRGSVQKIKSEML
jgi:hypothetical protein